MAHLRSYEQFWKRRNIKTKKQGDASCFFVMYLDIIALVCIF